MAAGYFQSNAYTTGNVNGVTYLRPVALPVIVYADAEATTLANLFADSDLTLPLDNPLTPDALGNFGFWTTAGAIYYNIGSSDVSYAGIAVSPSGGGTAGVASFNGRDGTVTAETGDYSATQIAGLAAVATSGSYTDLSNKPSIPAALSLTTTGSSGAATLSGSTLNIPQYSGGGGGGTTIISGNYDTSAREAFQVQNVITSPKNLAYTSTVGTTMDFRSNSIKLGYGLDNEGLNNTWTVSKSIEGTLTNGIRGISQSMSLYGQFYGKGDKAGIYSYLYYVGAPDAASDEGVTGITSQVIEFSNYYQGTVNSTTGTGDTKPVLNNGGSAVFDGSFLLNLSTSATLNLSGQLNGYSTVLEGFLNYLPVTISTGAVSGGLPKTTAWGYCATALAASGLPAANSQTVTVTMTLRNIAGTPQPFVNGHARLAGANAVEQVFLTVSAASGGTQSVTFNYRQANDAFYLFQGPLSDTYLSFDARVALVDNLMSSYCVVGSLTGTDLIYAVVRQGAVGSIIPYGAPDSSQGNYGGAEAASFHPDVNGNISHAGWHLYQGAEVVGVGSPISTPTPELEPNRIPWAAGQNLVCPQPATGNGGNRAWFVDSRVTPTYPSYANSGLVMDCMGPGIALGYTMGLFQNQNPESYYYASGGPLGKPLGLAIGGPYQSAIFISNTPDARSVSPNSSAIQIGNGGSNTTNLPWTVIALPDGQTLDYFLNNSTNNPTCSWAFGVDNVWYLKHPAMMIEVLKSYFLTTQTFTTANATVTQVLTLASGATPSSLPSTSTSYISSFLGGTWINMSNAGPSGIGDSGAGQNPWIARAGNTGQYFPNAQTGDIVFLSLTHRLLFGTSGTANATFMLSGNNAYFGTGQQTQVSSSGILTTQESTVASAATIAPTTALFHLTGTTSVSVMTPPLGFATTTGAGLQGGLITFIADAATSIAAGTSFGSFKTAFTTVAGTPYTCWFTPSTGLWYCK